MLSLEKIYSGSVEETNIDSAEDVRTAADVSVKLEGLYEGPQNLEALRNTLLTFVPRKYHDFIAQPEILEEMWQPREYLDAEKTKQEADNRRYCISLARLLENKLKEAVRQDQEKKEIESVRDSIGLSKSESGADAEAARFTEELEELHRAIKNSN